MSVSENSVLCWDATELGTYLDYALLMAESVPVLLVCDDEFAPLYAKPGDAGADLRSVEQLTLAPGERRLVKTGVRIALPDGYVGLVHPRSGLAAKHGITVLNTPGTIDSGYRGEIMVILFNTSSEEFEIAVGDRIAQLVVQEYVKADFVRVDVLPESDRSETGFGSSGKR
jgi:dUTP pyrophosphatase